MPRASPHLKAARDLARRGYSVFPLAENAKTPAISNWQNLATTDLSHIDRWWSTAPYNIGVTTGRLLVVDVDPRHDGHKTFAALSLVDEFPATAMSRTQGGGWHLIYALPDNVTIKGGANKLGPGVDIKSFGGYIAAPGSTIGDKGYSWIQDTPPAMAPEWLVALCKQPRARDAGAGKRVVEENAAGVELAEAWLAKHAPMVGEGARDNEAFKVAAKLYDYGVSHEKCHELLTDWAFNCTFPPLDESDIARIADSAGRNRSKTIGGAHPDAPGFEPVEIAARTVATVVHDDVLEQYADAAGKALTESGDPLVDGVIDRGTFSTWYGPPKSGKTFIVLWLCLCIAAGALWALRKCRRGAVVYVAMEGGRGIYKRLRAMQLQHPEIDGASLFVIRKQIDLLHGRAGVEFLAAQCKLAAKRAGLPVELIVIDTVARAITGGDENSPADMGALVQNLDALRDLTGAHVLGVHHTGKDKTKGMRGHSSLLGAVDTEIQVLDRRITSPNQRDLNDDLNLQFDLKIVPIGADAGGKPVTSCVVELRTGTPALMALTPQQQTNYDMILAAADDNLGFQFGWQVLMDAQTATQCAADATFNEVARKRLSKRLATLEELGRILYVSENVYVFKR